MYTSQNKDFVYTKLAFRQAEINLGSTLSNPSVGCVVVKKNCVITSGYTSFNGRPHAESNALKKDLNYKGSEIFITLEPCSHHGETPPCVDIIIRKKINRVIFSTNDIDPRSKNLAKKKLKKENITVKKFVLNKFAKKFYESYFLQSRMKIPFIDAKLAISKDYLTINKRDKWITNEKSRKLANFIRSKYDCILSTSKTVNDDNPLLDCRIEGLEKKSPTLIIVDRFFKIKKDLKMFRNINRKIYIVIKHENKKKELYFKKLGIVVLKLKKNLNYKNETEELFFLLKKNNFNRVLVEAGVTFLNSILKFNLIKNFYLFKSSSALKLKGYNNATSYFIKNIKLSTKNRIKVNLKSDNLYKVKLKHV